MKSSNCACFSSTDLSKSYFLCFADAIVNSIFFFFLKSLENLSLQICLKNMFENRIMSKRSYE